VTQPAPVPASDGHQGLADSDDLFAFDAIAAPPSAPPSAAPRAPLDAGALLDVFDDQPSASTTPAPSAAHTSTAAPAHAYPAASPGGEQPAAPRAHAQQAAPPALHASQAAAPVLHASQTAAPVLHAAPVSHRLWTLALGVVAAVVLLNAGVVWIALRDSSQTQQQMGELSASLLELARRPEAPPVAAPQPAVAPPVAAAVAHEPRVAEPAPPLPDYDPDPRREREFAAIEALLQQRLYAEARRQVYALLARCDALAGATRDAVESRATYLLARALHGEGAELPARVETADAAHAEVAR
jgi:hypothetical protein